MWATLEQQHSGNALSLVRPASPRCPKPTSLNGGATGARAARRGGQVCNSYATLRNVQSHGESADEGFAAPAGAGTVSGDFGFTAPRVVSRMEKPRKGFLHVRVFAIGVIL